MSGGTFRPPHPLDDRSIPSALTERPVPQLRRVIYQAAAGDLISAYRGWMSETQVAAEVARTYAGDVFAACRTMGADVIGISPQDGNAVLDDGWVRIRHVPWNRARGYRYHLVKLMQTLRMIGRAIRFRPEVLIISDRVVLWWMLAPLRLLGIRMFLALHVRMWPKRRHLLAGLDRWFLRHHCAGLLAVSHEIVRDLERAGLRAGQLPSEVFRPQYHHAEFARFDEPDPSHRPFRVLFVGRVEVTKGVLDLLDIAERIRKAPGAYDVLIDVVGDGEATAQVIAEIEARSLGDRVLLHGHLTREPVLDMFARSHVVIVPTRSNMGEGYNKVAAEAMLCHRPVIISATCPVLNDINSAAIEVPVDEVAPYADAILTLYRDPVEYQRLVDATYEVRKLYFDRGAGIGDSLIRLVARTATGRLPLTST